MPLSGYTFQAHYSIVAHDYCKNLKVFHYPTINNNRNGLFYLNKNLLHSLSVEDFDWAPMKFKDKNHFFHFLTLPLFIFHWVTTSTFSSLISLTGSVTAGSPSCAFSLEQRQEIKYAGEDVKVIDSLISSLCIN